MKKLILSAVLVISAQAFAIGDGPGNSEAPSVSSCNISVDEYKTRYNLSDDVDTWGRPEAQMLIRALNQKGYKFVSQSQAHIIFKEVFVSPQYGTTFSGYGTKAYNAFFDYMFKNETPGLSGLPGSGTWYHSYENFGETIEPEIAARRNFSATDSVVLYGKPSIEKAMTRMISKIPNCKN